jgi:hypothetical protein
MPIIKLKSDGNCPPRHHSSVGYDALMKKSAKEYIWHKEDEGNNSNKNNNRREVRFAELAPPLEMNHMKSSSKFALPSIR